MNQPEDSSEHPIAPGIRRDIERQLRAIEAEHGVKVLFACESGSRGWGFASPDSDYDVRFIYVHRLPWYLQVSPPRDVIELPISDELDISGWELRKALGLLKKGNATLVEWLASPVIYCTDEVFLPAMRQVAADTHQPERAFRHYLHMAHKNYREHLRGDTVRLKKYLYVLRPMMAAAWLNQGRGTVPMRFQELVDALVADAHLREAIDALLVLKRGAMESEYSKPFPVINAYIEQELQRLSSALPPHAEDPDFAMLDRLLMDTVLRLEPS